MLAAGATTEKDRRPLESLPSQLTYQLFTKKDILLSSPACIQQWETVLTITQLLPLTSLNWVFPAIGDCFLPRKPQSCRRYQGLLFVDENLWQFDMARMLLNHSKTDTVLLWLCLVHPSQVYQIMSISKKNWLLQAWKCSFMSPFDSYFARLRIKGFTLKAQQWDGARKDVKIQQKLKSTVSTLLPGMCFNIKPSIPVSEPYLLSLVTNVLFRLIKTAYEEGALFFHRFTTWARSHPLLMLPADPASWTSKTEACKEFRKMKLSNPAPFIYSDPPDCNCGYINWKYWRHRWIKEIRILGKKIYKSERALGGFLDCASS